MDFDPQLECVSIPVKDIYEQGLKCSDSEGLLNGIFHIQMVSSWHYVFTNGSLLSEFPVFWGIVTNQILLDKN